MDKAKLNKLDAPLLLAQLRFKDPMFNNSFWTEERKRLKLDFIEQTCEQIENGEIHRIAMQGDKPIFDVVTCRDYLQYYYHALEPADRYRITIDCYTTDGYNFPKKLLIGLKKIKPADYLKDLLTEYTDIEPLTVYRATATADIDKVKKELSWTLNKDTGQWFKDRADGFYLYKAIINKKDIIAYTNDREEYEVIQHGSVKNIIRL